MNFSARFYTTIPRLFLFSTLFLAAALGQSKAAITFAKTLSPACTGAVPIMCYEPSSGSGGQPEPIVGDTITLEFGLSGGSGPYTVALTSGTLPPGLALLPFQQQLQGTPTAPGSFTFTITASDSSATPLTASQTFSVTVVTQPLAVAGTLPGGVVQNAYPTSFYAEGGIPPYTWTVVRGSLPPGLTIKNPTMAFGNGEDIVPLLTGIPTTPGTFSFTLQVQDSSPTPLTLTQTYALSVIELTPFTDPNANNPTPNNTPAPFGITSANGSLWFTQNGPVATDQLGFNIYGIESVSTSGVFGNESHLTTHIINVSDQLAYPIPQAIILGPDGNFWVTDDDNGYIAQVKNGGAGAVVSLQNSSGAQIFPSGIASGGTEGGVWFTAVQETPGVGLIGRINPASPTTPTYYPITQPTSYPTGIVQNPSDGNAIWFLDRGGVVNPLSNAQDLVLIGRIPVPASTSAPLQPPSGCQAANAAAGFPTLNECIIPGTLGHVPVLNAGQAPVGPLMQVDSQGTVWFATKDQIGSISSDGSTTQVYPVPVPNNSSTWYIASITIGSDGAIWYIGYDQNNISTSYTGRVTTSGAVTEFTYQGSRRLGAITSGPDGALWITDPFNNAVLQVFPSLALSCTVPATLQVGVAITSASCTAFGGKAPYTYSFNTSNLPPGVLVSSAGVLSGTPTAPGSFTITAIDNSSPVQQATQVISIQPAAPIQFVCSFPGTATAGQPYSGSCTTAGGISPYTYTVSPALPAGLTGTATTPSATSSLYGFSVSGTISPTAFGTASFTITANDATKPTAVSSMPQAVSIVIMPVPLTLTCGANAQAVVGRPFQQTCAAAGGVPPYTFSASALPAGLTINASTGVISGTAATPSQSSVSVVVKDTSGQTATKTISLSVTNPKLALVCNFSALATVGTPYSTTCNATGGTSPYSLSVSSGALPAGLTLNAATGTISGTPTTAGPSSFVLLVTDSASPAATAQQLGGLSVQPTALTILTTTLPVPNVTLPYAAEVLVAGGTPPYTFTITAGALPAGLQLAAPSGAITTVSGVTLASGPYTFTVQVTDANNATATQAYSGTASATPLVQNFNSYALPGPSGANGITVGPDGALWFTTLDQSGGNLVGRITTAGVITTAPSANALTMTNLANFEVATGGDITPGPDGELWIAQRDGNTVGEITLDLSSQLTYSPTTPNASPAQITAAPDGAVWFTEAAASLIAHVDASGNLVELPTPTPASAPNGITLGPDNFIVFTEPGANKIGFVSEDGSVAGDVAIPTAGSLPTSIVMGPDNALWFTEFGASQIGRIDVNGNIQEAPVSSPPQAITLGPDGALYFTEPLANLIGRITIFGALTEIPIPDANSGPTGIAAGPDGAIWFTESNLSKIGRLSFILAPTVSCTLPAGPLQVGSTFSGSCTAAQGTPPYTFGATGTPPPGVNLDSNTGVISGTLTQAGSFTFTVVAQDSSSPPETGQATYTFAVTPLPLSLTCNTPAAALYTPYVGASQATYGCTPLNGTPPYSLAITSGTLPPGLTLNPSTGSITGSPTSLGNYPITVQVTDSSTPPMVVSQASTILVQYGSVTSSGTPLLTLSAPPLDENPGSNAPALTLTVNAPLPAALSGTATLTFKDYGGIFNTPAGYVDPALQFLNSSGTGTGTTYAFTIQPGTSSISIPTFNVGTVAGTVDITIAAAGLTQAKGSLVVPPATPVIEPGSVRFTNVTSSSFDLEFVATSATRAAADVSITINPSSGDTIVGQSTFVVDVTSVTADWFSSASGLKYGGRYSLTIPFQFNGPISAIGSATVTFYATAGNPSDPVTGTR